MATRIGSLIVFAGLVALLTVSAVNAEKPKAPLFQTSLGITHGAHLRPVYLPEPPGSLGPEDYGYGKEILNFNDLVLKDIGVVMYFAGWNASGAGSAFDPFLPILINFEITDPDRRPVIMITWTPVDGRAAYGCDQDYSGGVPPASIIAGNCDPFITDFANQIDARPERYILRFAHEMNITDSPWWPGNYNNDPNLYIDMYRHVHQIFVDEGVDNVEWMWSPNYASNPPPSQPGYEWNDIHNYYPGDDVVDWIGLSGYNWYDTPGQNVPWREFEFLYDDVLNDLTCRYAKPQIIAEIGTIEGNGTSLSKADWITNTYAQAPNYPFLRSIVWFNDYAYENPSSADFRVTTGSAASGTPADVHPLPDDGSWTDAYKAALDDPIYTSSLPSLAEATPANAICSQLYLPLIQR